MHEMGQLDKIDLAVQLAVAAAATATDVNTKLRCYGAAASWNSLNVITTEGAATRDGGDLAMNIIFGVGGEYPGEFEQLFGVAGWNDDDIVYDPSCGPAEYRPTEAYLDELVEGARVSRFDPVYPTFDPSRLK